MPYVEGINKLYAIVIRRQLFQFLFLTCGILILPQVRVWHSTYTNW